MAQSNSLPTDAVDPSLFFSRNDVTDPRLGDWAGKDISAKDNFTLLGYPDDEGIRLNGGRLGASHAPNEIRKYFYKMTPPVLKQDRGLFDLGNLKTQSFDLKTRHEEAKKIVRAALKESRVLTLGGGHDYGYPDGAGFLEFCADKKTRRPLVINFDAHLDVRPTDRGLTSGTPFFRLLENYKNRFDFFEVGLQPQCNSLTHLQWAEDRGAKTIFMQEIRAKGLLNSLKAKLPKKRCPLFLSLDIDALSSSEAPGCSQSWPTGIAVAELWPTLQWLFKNYDTKILSIYEVSPPLDVASQTSKLAALVAYEYLFSEKRKK